MRVAIMGYSGAGKSTLAKYISGYYHLPLLHLDTVQFEPNWVERDREEAVSIVAAFMRNKDWVIDGNYACFLQKERLEQADHIIYMAFSRWSCLIRACRRYRRNQGKSREDMANGCMEKLDPEFIWWILHEGRTKRKKKDYHKILGQHHAKVTVLKNQKQLDAFMNRLFDGIA